MKKMVKKSSGQMNKKIKNATFVDEKLQEDFMEQEHGSSRIKNVSAGWYNGTYYRSKLEIKCAELLDKLQIPFEYEPLTISLLESFKYKDKTCRAIKYKPDFLIGNIIIECKGFETPEWKIKRKLLFKYLNEQDKYQFYEVHSRQELIRIIEMLNLNIHAVDVFTKQGEFLGNWPSVSDAVKALNLKSKCNITNCLCGLRKNAQGLVWKYHPTEVPFLENEIWKPVVGLEDLYAVSNKGRVASLQYHGKETFSLLKPTPQKLNYKTVRLRDWKRGKTFQCQIHRLVAEAFIPNPENKPQVDHIDTDPSNNAVENLRWVTPKENQNNPRTLARLQTSLTNYNKSEKHKADVQETQGHPILQYDRQGNLLAEYPSMNSAAVTLSTTACCIKRVCDGHRKYHRNWIFKYKIEQ